MAEKYTQKQNTKGSVKDKKLWKTQMHESTLKCSLKDAKWGELPTLVMSGDMTRPGELTSLILYITCYRFSQL